jgi:cytochrome c551/c552
MKRSIVILLFSLATLAGRADNLRAQVIAHQAVLEKYCVTCHNEQTKTAGLMLDRAIAGTLADNAAVWEKVVRKLRAREMPPPGLPKPDAASYGAVISYFESELDKAAGRQTESWAGCGAPLEPNGIR